MEVAFSLSTLIITTRKNLHLSQQKFASMLNVSPTTIRNLEKERHCPNTNTLLSLCFFYSLTIQQIILLLPPNGNRSSIEFFQINRNFFDLVTDIPNPSEQILSITQALINIQSNQNFKQ